MKKIIVVDKLSDLSFSMPGVDIIDAQTYLREAVSLDSSCRIFNLCRDLEYCRKGYYVSLIAEARGHRPMPSVLAIMDLKSTLFKRGLDESFAVDLNKLFSSIRGDEFELSVYFGQNMAQRYLPLCKHLFAQLKAPLIRARFAKKSSSWILESVKTMSFKDVPTNHREFLNVAMSNYFRKGDAPRKKKRAYRYELAILVNPKETMPPSNAGAIKKFISAAEDCRLLAEVVQPKDINKIPQFDALFIRETTDVNSHTFRFARFAEEEGLISIDDSSSILRCCNKIYLNYALQKKGLPIPVSKVISKSALLSDLEMAYPIVVKKPDSAFSMGVKKAENIEQLQVICAEYFKKTELLILQEFMPTDFDWRIGIIDGEPIYACRYFMAGEHWQVVDSTNGKIKQGRVETLSVGQVPKELLKISLSAAKIIGDGLYGIDIKEYNGEYYVIEVNDNPNIDKGYEDQIAKDYLYRRIMETFYKRLEMR